MRYRFEYFREHSDDSITLFTLERKEDHERSRREADVQRIVTHLPIDLRVRDIKDSFERAATESETKLVTYQTLRSVAAYKIFGRRRMF
jgi:hypothetical protein